MLVRSVRSTIDKYRMLIGGELVVVGVSGGPDSVALLHVLNALRPVYKADLHVAHLEHGLRGKAAIADMKFVRSLCGDLGIPCTTRSIDVKGLAKASTLSVEAVGRKTRYAFLEEVRRETGAARIATGHTANDQAETLLLNLIRGSGILGLRGIRPVFEDRIIRPLIGSTRQEVLDHLEKNRLAFRIDDSNLDMAYDRNRVRQLLIPLIEREFNPRIVDSLVRTSNLFSSIADYIEEEVARGAGTCLQPGEGRATIDLKRFVALSPAVRTFILYAAVRALEGDDQVATYEKLSAVDAVARGSESGARIDIGSGLSAIKEFDILTVGRNPGPAESYTVPLAVPGVTLIETGPCEIEVSMRGERSPLGRQKASPGRVKAPTGLAGGSVAAHFDLAGLALPLVARSWHEGDRFRPFGMRGSKKVQDVFVDEKIPLSRRGRIPLVCDRKGIIWIAGVKRSARAPITSRTRDSITLTLRKDGHGRGS